MKGFEIRRNEDGTIDEVVAVSDDETLSFHIEQMDDDAWYFGLYDHIAGGELHQFNIYRHKKKVIVASYEDSPADALIRRTTE